MKIKENKKGKVALFSLEGRLDSTTSTELEKRIFEAIKEGHKDIILEMTALDYISSAGIRVLVRCHKELEKEQGHICLASVPRPIENILYITGFLPYFKVFESSNLAIHALEPENEPQ